MSGVKLDGIVKAYGALQVVHGIDLNVAEKEFVVLVHSPQGPRRGDGVPKLRALPPSERRR